MYKLIFEVEVGFNIRKDMFIQWQQATNCQGIKRELYYMKIKQNDKNT